MIVSRPPGCRSVSRQRCRAAGHPKRLAATLVLVAELVGACALLEADARTPGPTGWGRASRVGPGQFSEPPVVVPVGLLVPVAAFVEPVFEEPVFEEPPPDELPLLVVVPADASVELDVESVPAVLVEDFFGSAESADPVGSLQAAVVSVTTSWQAWVPVPAAGRPSVPAGADGSFGASPPLGCTVV